MKDAYGNELAKGQTVQLTLPAPQVVAHISEMTAGGITTGLRKGGSWVSLGTITLFAKWTIPFDPTNPVLANLIRIHTPEEDGQAGEVAGPPMITLAN